MTKKQLKPSIPGLAPRKVVRGAAPVFLPKNPKNRFLPRLARKGGGGATAALATAAVLPEEKEVKVAEGLAQDEAMPEGLDVLERAVTAEEEEEEKRPSEEPSNFLALYFKEMAALHVLQPEEEFEAARKIERLELALWNRIFSYAPMVEQTLMVIERALENSLPEFAAVRRTLRDHQKAPTDKTTARLAKAAAKASEKLRAIDIDRRLQELVVQEIRTIGRGDATRAAGGKLAFSPKGRAFQKYLREVGAGGFQVQQAKNEFVKANLRLVVSIARRFNHGRMALSDLIQEGNIGLMKAVERFDYRRGYRFSTYASWWIRHAISRALADKGRAVRLPVHMIDAYHRVARSKRELGTKLGRQPTSEEIGEATGIASQKIEKMRTYLLDQSLSLDRSVSDEDGRKFIDFLSDPNQEEHTPVEELVDQAMLTEVRKLLLHLKPIESDILRQRFGLTDDKELTLKEIGEKYNLSRERIRQLQEQALTKMRRALQRRDML